MHSSRCRIPVQHKMCLCRWSLCKNFKDISDSQLKCSVCTSYDDDDDEITMIMTVTVLVILEVVVVMIMTVIVLSLI